MPRLHTFPRHCVVTCLLSLSLFYTHTHTLFSGRGQSWSPRSTSRGDSSRLSLSLSLFSLSKDRQREKEANNRETFDCIRESIESVAAQKGRPGQNKGTRLESLSGEMVHRRTERGETHGHTAAAKGREKEKGKSGEPGEAAWKKDLDCAAVRDVDGCCGPNQPPTAKNLIRCHNYTQWRSTSVEGRWDDRSPEESPRFCGQRKWFLLMGFMLTNADWPGEEDSTCRFFSLDARFFRDDATCSVSVLPDDRGERPDPSIRRFRGIRDTCRRLIRI